MAKMKIGLGFFDEFSGYSFDKTLKNVLNTLRWPFKTANKGHKEKSVIIGLIYYIVAIISFPIAIFVAGLLIGFEAGKQLILMPIRTIFKAIDEIKGYL